MERNYQFELGYLKESARTLTALNPKLEKYLGETATDPDTEKLIETFAFLSSRVRSEIDNEMHDFTTSILSMVCPTLINPFPSATLIKFNPIEKAITKRQQVEAHSVIKSKQYEGHEDLFLTAFDCKIYPLEIENIALYRNRDDSSLTIDFQSLSDQPLSQIGLEDLRITFTGRKEVKSQLYLWIGKFLKKTYIQFPDGRKSYLNIEQQLENIGFENDEALLPQLKDNFLAHRILNEYFIFPDKFLGYNFTQLSRHFQNANDKRFKLVLDFNRPFPTDVNIKNNDLALYVVPAINLYHRNSTMIEVREDKTYYDLQPSGQSVANVSVYDIFNLRIARQNDLDQNLTNKIEYKPFIALSQDTNASHVEEDVFYKTKYEKVADFKNRKISINFCQRNGQPAIPDNRTLVADLLCFDQKLSQQLNIGDICYSTDSIPAFVSYQNITKPTEVIYPPQDSQFNWNLISGLSPNYHDLHNTTSIKNLIRKYNYIIAHNRQEEREFDTRLNGITSVKTQPVDRLFLGRPVRGIRTVMHINEDAFPSLGEIYFFGSILSHFFRLYATTNAFHQLEIKLNESGESFEWPIRNGTQPLI